MNFLEGGTSDDCVAACDLKAAQAIRQHAPAALAEAQAKLTPLAKRAGQQLKDKAQQLRGLIERRKEGK